MPTPESPALKLAPGLGEPTPSPTLTLLVSKLAEFRKSRVLVICPPTRSVLPATLTWKPPSPARMPLYSEALW